MTLKTYSAKIAKLAEEYPNATVIYAADDEGNDFRELNFSPTAGNFGGGEFINDDGTEEFKQEYKINCICVN